MSKNKYIIFVGALIIALLGRLFLASPESTDYWVWRQSDLNYVSKIDSLIIYQGDYLLPEQPVEFIKRGPAPYKLVKRNSTNLLIRLYDIQAPENLSDHIVYLIEAWSWYDVQIKEVQLDYDSPSSQLVGYAKFIRLLKKELIKNNVQVEISITGLLTWLSDSAESLGELSDSVYYIDYQLYDVYHPLTNVKNYFPFIALIKHPYKIGITTSEQFQNMEFPQNEYYKGKSIFLNISK